MGQSVEKFKCKSMIENSGDFDSGQLVGGL